VSFSTGGYFVWATLNHPVTVSATERIGECVELVYFRVDADGTLREVRLTPAV
jgi:hypothetical protein